MLKRLCKFVTWSVVHAESPLSHFGVVGGGVIIMGMSPRFWTLIIIAQHWWGEHIVASRSVKHVFFQWLICACVCACVMNEPLVHSSMHAQYILPLNWSRSSVYVGVRLIALAPITKPLLYETLYLTSQEQIIITTCCICW